MEEISSSEESGFQSDTNTATSDQAAATDTAKDVASSARVMNESLGENEKEKNGRYD